MAATTGVLVGIFTSMTGGLLEEVVKKAAGAISQSSAVSNLVSSIFGDLEPDLRRLHRELCKLNSVLRRAERIDPMHCDDNELLLLWLKDVKEAVRFADNLLDEVAYEKIKLQMEESSVAEVSGFAFRTEIAEKIEKFMLMADEIRREAEATVTLERVTRIASTASYLPPPTSIFENVREIRANPDTSVVLGREADEELIVTKLCSPNTNSDFSVVAIVGRSGLGKTTLARIVYDNGSVGEHFGKKTWIFVSDHFKLERFLDEMLQSITGQSHSLSNITAMEDKLQQCLKEEKKGYFLVLDDVWNTDEHLWKSVESSLLRVFRFTRCMVLVTTQSFDVARKMCASPAHELKDLGDDDAWELFKKLAFANKSDKQFSDLEDVGRSVLRKCSGLPLAIKAMGTLLGSMKDKSQWESVKRSEIWGLSLDQSNVMPWLLISFHHLPNAAIKQCFAHFSIIMKKGKFALRSEVIQGWMAQGFIQSTMESEMSMEDIGEKYLSHLVASGLLQVDFGYTEKGLGYLLWMHDLVHDLAFFITKDTVWIPKEDSDLQTPSSEVVEHLRICSDNHWNSKYNLPKGNKLRTLICAKATLPVDFALQSKYLRDLRLIDCEMEEVPSSIEELKHLRYLSLRNNRLLRQLPESIGKLLHLQNLDLVGCDNLHELPQGITKLVNLRHILRSEKAYVKMPKGMGLLTCLRTLPRVELSEKKGVEIQELKSLTSLNGVVDISGFEHISHKEDAAEASLKTKTSIRNLVLRWRLSDEREPPYNDKEIMDGLHPHSGLTEIKVYGFGGKIFSSWLLDMHHLKTITLSGCKLCEQLPTLGQLASLEEICIDGMGNLEVIGMEFYHSDEGTTTASFNNHKRRTLFPRLKHLRFYDMEKLREWVEPSGSVYEVFPCLETLQIKMCPLLDSAPTCFQSLLYLMIDAVESEEPVMNILTSTSNLLDLSIQRIEQLTSLSHPLSQCTSLKNLYVMECDSLACISDMEGLVSLQFLRILMCKNLRNINGVESCVSMEKLTLSGNSKLEFSPDLRSLSRLTELTLFDLSPQIMSIPEWLSSLPSLRKLGIGGRGFIAKQLEAATHLVPMSLEELEIHSCLDLISLPEWLGDLSSLRKLYIIGCENLKYLPSLEAMRRLTQLTELDICWYCPILKERCRRETGEEWHKISHIPHIRIWD